MTILIIIAAVVIIFLIFVAMQPNEFRVSRSAVMTVPSEVVFAQVNDFHNWEAWNPWGKLDPAMKQLYDGPSSGVGASYSWTGNGKVGAGRMTITESQPYHLIRIKLEFMSPFKATNMAAFTFKPELTFKPAGAQTEVTWSMTGKKPFISKMFCLFMSMDKMVGGMYEKGLASMKSIVEAAGAK
jgi:hypothetical protein